MTSITTHDHRTRHCRMLGHEVPFGYCRQTDGKGPCRKIFDCWFETFDIKSFMQEHHTSEQIAALLAPPKPKVLSLYELIQQARQNAPDSQD